jgi:hypothetical protein
VRAVAALVLSLACLAGASVATAKGPKDKSTSYVVKFQSGTPDKTMRKTVKAAGGEVTTDLPQISTVDASAKSPSFASTVAQSPLVVAVSVDKHVHGDDGPSH